MLLLSFMHYKSWPRMELLEYFNKAVILSNWSLDQVLLPRNIMARATSVWELDFKSRIHSLKDLTKTDAMRQFLGVFRALSDGHSVFFHVSRIHDPIGFLPEEIILGINKTTIHFYRPVVMECLQSAELKDIALCERNNEVLSFKILIVGVCHIFQFRTKQAKEIGEALQTLIGDAMLHCTSKARSSSDEYQRNACHLQNELYEKQEELDGLKESLKAEKINTSDYDRLKSLYIEKDEALKVAILEKKNM